MNENQLVLSAKNLEDLENYLKNLPWTLANPIFIFLQKVADEQKAKATPVEEKTEQ